MTAAPLARRSRRGGSRNIRSGSTVSSIFLDSYSVIAQPKNNRDANAKRSRFHSNFSIGTFLSVPNSRTVSGERNCMCAVVVRVRQYLVLKGHGHWFVKSLGRLGAPYSSEARAIRNVQIIFGSRCLINKVTIAGLPFIPLFSARSTAPRIALTSLE